MMNESFKFFKTEKIWHKTVKERVKIFHAPKVTKFKEKAIGQDAQWRQQPDEQECPLLLSGSGKKVLKISPDFWKNITC